MTKVLQISNYYYPHLGGTEQVARDISNAIKDDPEINTKVICFNETSSDGGHICHRGETVHEIIDGIEVIKCGCIAKVASQSLSLTFGRKLDSLFKEFDPDIVIFHYPNPFQAYYLLKHRKRKFKLVLYWHLDITKQKTLKHLFHHQNLALIRRMDYVLGATPVHVETSEFTKAFGNKKVVLPYMIDTNSLVLSPEDEEKAREIREKYNDKIICFFVGRHVPYKGLKYLIDASREIKSDNIRILIAGSGELTESLKKQADGDKKIEFLGRISDSERRAYYKACDIICFPSITRNEGFGLALAEGMFFGKPAITFRIEGSGVNFVNLANVTGLECPNADSHAYAEALKLLAENREMREKMGKAAKERVEENFTPDKFKQNIIELIRSLKSEA